MNQVMDAPIAKASACVGNVHDPFAQLLGLSIHLRRMATTVSAQPHKTAGAAL
jgi:hypothetical protein